MIKKLLYFFTIKFGQIDKSEEIVSYNDVIGLEIILNGFYEKNHLDLLLKSFNKNILSGTYIDVGSNIGNHLLYFSKHFKKLVGFEPQKKTFQILDLNVNSKDNIEVHNFGLDKNSSDKTINIPLNGSGGGTLLNHEKSTETRTEKVQLRVYDELFDIKISYIKIDTEGYELNVIKSMYNSIIKHKPIISFELNSSFIEDKKIIHTLQLLGYEKFYIPNYTLFKSKKGIVYKLIRIIINIIRKEYRKLKEISVNELLNGNKSYELITTYNKDSIYKLNV
mgnify:CR=1 FL=1|tara:strand:- start:10017 stop:10853 length:837 start_codon:yes stop_codon:yes gene_type:complete